MLIVTRAGDVPHTESLSTMTQSIGYMLGAFAPLAVGAIHGAANSWTPSLILLLALVVPELVIGLAAARHRGLGPAARCRRVRGPRRPSTSTVLRTGRVQIGSSRSSPGAERRELRRAVGF